MSTQEGAERRQQPKGVAEAYFREFQQQDFAAIPYDEDVTLRAPLAPGGVNRPLVGKAALRSEWWQPLEPALTGFGYGSSTTTSTKRPPPSPPRRRSR